MDTTTSAVASGIIVTAGLWAEGKPFSVKVALGAGFLAIGLAILSGINDQLARGFALLVLISVLLRYGVAISKKTGLAK
jgi:hypothetical protein